MPNSFATTAHPTCKQCHHAFTIDLWLIVDSAERPDLIERVKDRSIHLATCPNCHHSQNIESDILILRHNEKPNLIFSPKPGAFLDLDNVKPDDLIKIYRNNLIGNICSVGSEEQTVEPVTIHRLFLPAVLSGDIQEALTDLKENIVESLATMHNESPSAFQQLIALAGQILGPSSFRKLLSDTEFANDISDDEITSLDEEFDVDLQQIVSKFLYAPNWTESQKVVEEYAVLLTDEAYTYLTQLIELQTDDKNRYLLADHRRLLAECRKNGIYTAFQDQVKTAEIGMRLEYVDLNEIPPEMQSTYEMLKKLPPQARLAVMQAFNETSSPEEMLGVLENRPDLQFALRIAGVTMEIPESTKIAPSIPLELRTKARAAQELLINHQHSNEPNLLEQATLALKAIIAHPEFDSTLLEFQLTVLSNLGTVYLEKAQNSNSLELLDAGIQLFEQVLDLCFDNDPRLAIRQNNLAVAFRNRYRLSQEVADIERSISLSTKVIEQTRENSEDLAIWYSNLGKALVDRYEFTGQPSDLDLAISAFEKTVEFSSTLSPQLPSYLNSLGIYLSLRYEQQGLEDDATRAIEAIAEAMDRLPKASPNKLDYTINYGNCYGRCYAVTGNIGYLRQAIAIYISVILHTPSEAQWIHLRHCIAISLLFRYNRSQSVIDLHNAVVVFFETIELSELTKVDGYCEGLSHAVGVEMSQHMTAAWQEIVQESSLYDRFKASENYVLLREHLSELLNSETADETAEILKDNPQLLSTEVDNILTRMIGHQESLESKEYLETYRILLQDAQELGIEQALAKRFERNLVNYVDLVTEYLVVETLDETQQIIRKYPSLLSAMVDPIFDDLLNLEELDIDLQSHIVTRRNLLKRSREIGTEQAFKEYKVQQQQERFAHVPAELRAITFMPEDAQKQLREFIPNGHPAEIIMAIYSKPELIESYENALEKTEIGWIVGDLKIARIKLQEYTNFSDHDVLSDAIGAIERLIYHPNFSYLPRSTCFSILYQGSDALLTEFHDFNVMESLKQSISYLRRVYEWNELPLEMQTDVAYRLGTQLLLQYEQTMDLDNLGEGIALHQQALTHLSDTSPHMAGFMNDLANGLYRRFERLGNKQDLDQAIEFREKAINYSSDLEFRLQLISSFAMQLITIYEQTGDVERLNKAIEICRKNLDQSAQGMEKSLALMDVLGIALGRRYEYSSNADDLNESIKFFQTIVKNAAGNSPNRITYLNNLGNGYRNRYERLGDDADLDNAVQIYQELAEQSPSSFNSVYHIANYGSILRMRYSRYGNIEDLDRSIKELRKAVELTPPTSPIRPGLLNNLANALSIRYNYKPQAEYIDQAINLYEIALQLVADDSPDVPRYLDGLSTALLERFRSTHYPGDLLGGVQCAREALKKTTSTNSIERPGRLNTLANALGQTIAFSRSASERWEKLIEMRDLYQEALDVTDPQAPSAARYRSHIANCLCDMYDLAKNDTTYFSTRYGLQREQILEKAIEQSRLAVKQTPHSSHNLPEYLKNLGKALAARYESNHCERDFHAATNAYEEACKLGIKTAPSFALTAAYLWGEWSIKLEKWEAATLAFRYALEAADLIVSLQILKPGKERALREIRNIHTTAAYVFVHSGLFKEAVETVERGRARLLTDSLEQNRKDLERLPSEGYGDLLKCFRQSSHNLNAFQMMKEPNAQIDFSDRLHTLNSKFTEFNAIIEEIRQIPGYENFLINSTFDRISQAAQETFLVYILATSYGGMALVVDREDVLPVQLPMLTHEKIQQWLIGDPRNNSYTGWLEIYEDWTASSSNGKKRELWLNKLDEVTGDLWQVVMGPISTLLKARLANTIYSQQENTVPQVILLPTGLLSILPLHTAYTTEKSDRHYFIDDFAVSYTPSARILQHCREQKDTISAQDIDRLLAIDEPKPTTAGELPNSRSEVAAIADLFKDKMILRNQEATKSSVLNNLPECQVAHFSCHGFSEWFDPLESGLLMANNEKLTVRDLYDRKGLDLRMVTLSACETGVVGQSLPDEVVMLPTALIQAGCAGVVASLWSVADVSTAMLMARFYDLWRGEGVAPVQALRQAQQWVRDTTNQEKADYFATHVPEWQSSGAIKMAAGVAAEFFNTMEMHKDGPAARTFAHPFWWAAFTFTGV